MRWCCPRQDVAKRGAASCGSAGRALRRRVWRGGDAHDATERALQVVRERAADAVIAVGGGSTIGLSKAIALRTDLLQVVLPTTYAGSEMTPILGETKDAAHPDVRQAP